MLPLRFTFLLVAAASFLTGCESYRQAVRDVGHSLGAIGTRDMHRHETWKTILYENSGYTRSQIEVTPGSGVTHLTIREVRPGEYAAALTANLHALAARNPELLGPIEVSTQLRP